ncbi:hypothetical protein [Kitasatospora sp. NPDC058046]|uniref:hypothetical protein n=1 Tax=Kitasatospora sp. NPDC058046 TaxID=3346312 RepID=UPI0036DBDE2B
MTTTLATRADAAHALLMMLIEHEAGPRPEFGLYEYMVGSGEQGWGLSLVVRDSLGAFEYWRRVLGLRADSIDYDTCHRTVWLCAVGDYAGVEVQLHSMAEIPPPGDTGR